MNKIVLALILSQVIANEEPIRMESNEGKGDQTEEDFIKIYDQDHVNTSIPEKNNQDPIVGPLLPNIFQYLTTSTRAPTPLNLKEFNSQLDGQQLLKYAYNGCISLFGAVITMFTALFQRGGLLAPDGLISFLLSSPLGAGGPFGQHGLLSQLFYWVFRKDGILGANGLFHILLRGLNDSLRRLELNGLKGVGYSAIK